jgi:hypothetical protein
VLKDIIDRSDVVVGYSSACRLLRRAGTPGVGSQDAECEGLRKRVRELEALEPENEGLKKRVRELEAVEAGWKHLGGVFRSS